MKTRLTLTLLAAVGLAATLNPSASAQNGAQPPFRLSIIKKGSQNSLLDEVRGSRPKFKSEAESHIIAEKHIVVNFIGPAQHGTTGGNRTISHPITGLVKE